ncbi:putative internal virion protein [Erwinia phage Micant]|uniref:Internal virion protein n=1 Tax=Erwinia phage Micant TaxID=2923255 RepID=A0AAE9FHB5_9CAUD|nr:putative internal virion protein [Erwinia phage Micant]
MVDFRRAPGTPADTEANAKAAPAQAEVPMMDYNDATDMGLQAPQRQQMQADASRVAATRWQSAKGGFSSSVMGAAWDKLHAPDFEPDHFFDAGQTVYDDPRINQTRPDNDELDYLKRAVSLDDYSYRYQNMLDYRQDQVDAADHPWVGGAAMIAPDLLTMVIPGVSEAALGRTAGTAIRVMANAYDAGAALYSADQLGQDGVANSMMAMVGVGDLAHLATRGMARTSVRADRAVDDIAAEAEQAAAKDGNRGSAHTDADPDSMAHAADTGVHPKVETDDVPLDGNPHDLVTDPDNPTLPKSTRDIDDDLATADSIPARDVQATDYSMLADMPVNTNKAAHGKKVMDSTEGASIVDNVPMRPAMARAMDRLDELAGAGKLPVDFPQQYRTIMRAIADNAEDVPIRFDRKSNFRGRYRPNDLTFTDHNVKLPFPKAAVGTGKSNVSDLIGHMDAKELRTFLHESIHAATSRVIARAEHTPSMVTPGVKHALDDMDNLRRHLTAQMAREVKEGTLTKAEQHYIKYYLKNNHELIAGLGDNQGNFTAFLQRQPSVRGKESALRSLGKQIMRVLGMGTERTALTDVADALEDMLAHGPVGNGKLGKQALSRAAPSFSSDAMSELTAVGLKAAQAAPDSARATADAAKAMLDTTKNKMAQHFALYDDLVRAGEEGADARRAFADMLVTDGSKVGERTESVSDYKRLMKSEMDMLTGEVEKSITDNLKANGVGWFDQFFNRANFVAKRREVEEKLAHYLDYAHTEYKNGRPVDTPPEEIKDIVKRYTDSNWAERWFDHMENSGMVKADSPIERSPYYLPRRYSRDRVMRMQREHGFQQKDFVDGFSAAMRDTYPAMDRDLSRQVARTWYQGMTSAQPAQGAQWRRAVNGMSNDEFVEMLIENGVTKEDAAKILEGSVFAQERTGSNAVKQLRKRNELDMQKEYTTSSGRTFRMQDLVDTDVTKLMNQYNNRMSGKAAFTAKGYGDAKDLVNKIEELRPGLGNDVDGWTKKVDDTVDTLLGHAVGGDTPQWALAGGYLSNALMLKNSGLYQIMDISLAAKEFGLYRTTRAMMQGGLWRTMQTEIGADKALANRLTTVLSGSTKNDMRFKWLHTYAEDNTDLTRSSQMVSTLRNASQAAHTVNGMRYVHAASVNLNAGLVRDAIMSALQGNAKDAKLLQKFGLRESALNEMRQAYAANPGAAFRQDLQTHLEISGQRFMDYVVQQVRTGETSHFAEMNPIGRVIIGYQSFAMAGTNKILRRQYNDGGVAGLAMLMMYQLPLAIMMQKLKATMDNKDQSGKELVSAAAWSMSAIGGASLLQPLFEGAQGGSGGSVITGGLNQILSSVQNLFAKGGDMTAKDVSKIVPLAQEFLPLRAVINNMGD